jgi:hypothetical protein
VTAKRNDIPLKTENKIPRSVLDKYMRKLSTPKSIAVFENPMIINFPNW